MAHQHTQGHIRSFSATNVLSKSNNYVEKITKKDKNNLYDQRVLSYSKTLLSEDMNK